MPKYQYLELWVTNNSSLSCILVFITIEIDILSNS